ncbi:unnamed protein product [Ixodes persulcatus]
MEMRDQPADASVEEDLPRILLNATAKSDELLLRLSGPTGLPPLADNVSNSAELLCYAENLNSNATENRRLTSSGPFCRVIWDGVSCWPATRGSSQAVIPCFASFNSLFYDTSQNATRDCWPNGTWADRSDYSNCRPLLDGISTTKIDETMLCYIGYSLSFAALTVAIWIFSFYRDLRCSRNTIHVNLMVTYLLISITWIITASLQSQQWPSFQKAACFLYIVLTYLMGTNFFWMFVEGLYLYILVVKTFSVDAVRMHVYVFIGWGIPALIVCVWALTKAYLSPNHNDPNLAEGMCIWQLRDIYDCIFIAPVMLVLLINIIFLGGIMWVLITKLKAATTAESQQYRKAAKALLVLIPLLGVTYILVIWKPAQKEARAIFTYLQVALLPTQGFTVAVLYCFMNGDVRKAVRHHVEQWQTMRAVKKSNGRRRSSTYKFGEPVSSRKRGSAVSFTTTTTLLGSNRFYSSWKRHSTSSSGTVGLKDDIV